MKVIEVRIVAVNIYVNKNNWNNYDFNKDAYHAVTRTVPLNRAALLESGWIPETVFNTLCNSVLFISISVLPPSTIQLHNNPVSTAITKRLIRI